MSGTDHPVATIDAAPLLASPGVISVVEALASGERDVRFVGGCVRDLLVDRDIADIDVATPDTPEEVTRLLEDRGIKVVPTGLSHGTVTAVVEGRGIEVTTLRVDVATDGRHAEVAFTGDWQADAARRDFTINAMSLRPSGDLFDYFGGRGDLADGRVRFVGDAAGRIAEDRLRVLRYFRFLAHYGHGVPDRQAMAACASARSCLGRLAAERIQSELFGLLGAPHPLPALDLMASSGVLENVLPEANELTTLGALTGIDDRDPVRRLAALTPAAGAAVARRLRCSKAVRRRLARLAPPALALESDWPVPDQRQALYDLGAQTFRDLVLLAWAADRAWKASRWRAMLDTVARWENPRFPLRGRDVLAAGIRPGPEVKAILGDVEAWWRREDFRPDRTSCLERLAATAGRTT
ncbi:MAG: CCA tRNA nucleotidyltransferase [bacterium]|nr:CCA tRNA nucleotidyltransferase [bacterium]